MVFINHFFTFYDHSKADKKYCIRVTLFKKGHHTRELQLVQHSGIVQTTPKDSPSMSSGQSSVNSFKSSSRNAHISSTTRSWRRLASRRKDPVKQIAGETYGESLVSSQLRTYLHRPLHIRRFLKFPRDPGIPPDRRLSFNHNSCKSTRFPSVTGICPLMKLLSKRRETATHKHLESRSMSGSTSRR
jgi:hypothetical protein